MSDQIHPFLKRIAKTQDNPYQTHLIYGPSGAGKTTLLASAAEDDRVAPMCILAFDGGRRSAQGVDPDRVTVVPINTWEDYNEAYDFLVKHARTRFKSCAVDSLSETHVYSLLGVLEFQVNSRERREDINALEIADYGKSMVQIRRFIRAWRDLPLHMFFTATSKEITVAKLGRVSVPSMFGQLSEEVVGMFDVAAFLALEEQPITKDGKTVMQQRRMLSLQNATNVRVKVRTPYGKRLKNDTIPVPKTGQMTAYLNAIEDYV